MGRVVFFHKGKTRQPRIRAGSPQGTAAEVVNRRGARRALLKKRHEKEEAKQLRYG